MGGRCFRELLGIADLPMVDMSIAGALRLPNIGKLTARSEA